jgi:RNA polymerase sigma-70 factor (ECF subfamily)
MPLTTPLGTAIPLNLDATLAARAAGGDEGAFEALYRRHVARVHTLVRRMADPAAADDITQDIFIRAWNKLGSFRGESAFGTWLHRLAVNVVLTRRRAERTSRAWLTEGDVEVDKAPGRSVSPAIAIDLEAAIARLPEGARQVFVLHDVEGWTHEEIAERLGLVAGTSKSQLSRARAALRRMLDAG